MKALKWSILSLLAFSLSGCITRQEVKAEIWLQSGLPAAVCAAHPEVARSGIYRRLNDEVCKKAGKKVPCYEVLSYCKPQITHYLSIKDEKLNEWMDAYLPKEKNQ